MSIADDDTRAARTPARPEPLFAGDQGRLPAEVRATLVRVLSSRFVDGVRHAPLWNRVLRHEDVLRSRLHDLYLELVVDRRRQVAFTQQLELEDDVPVLLRRDKPLTLAATVLLLHLRQEYDRGAVEGRDVVVEHRELLDHLEAWKDVDDQNPAQFRRRCESAVENVKEKGVLAPVSDGRYRISGIVHSMLTAEKVDAMTAALAALATGEGGEQGDQDALDDHDEQDGGR
ncbi:DUF4194 domain-containing protein [Cellulomonas shaoxiangyii]|uniref:DUF4194 domain-containing protein n=1 Tax=Cellulomonas shaoxiangyii TaxID=2566013 RepID=A0A4P7SI44_9CELL|nr:DUF4194 domain-containing protein [Cellulomonas shaoxiangyii]QCB93278.1 DUF4194 domain-containing protein [Cellulomonas shaoxiangyii]TGY78651.1 DUF4194 domain-containing protein [Cellulomonas shaoxiangyii]